jgi:hypothetical protein
MSIQLPLPAGWAIGPLSSNLDPQERLKDLARDKLEAKVEIRAALDRLAIRQGLAARDIGQAVQGYADDMINDAAYERQRTLEREIEARDAV